MPRPIPGVLIESTLPQTDRSLASDPSIDQPVPSLGQYFSQGLEPGSAAARDLAWQPDDRQLAQLDQLYGLVLAGNQRANLTRIVEPAEFWEKHLWDSLRGLAAPVLAHWRDRPLATGSAAINPADHHPANDTLADSQAAPIRPLVRAIDIGTGAGFPGLPIAIAQPHWHMTLVDSIQKKTDFLESAVAALGLGDRVAVRRDRAERLAQTRDRYDLATLRAVAAATTCAQYALPLLAPGGIAILYRGHWTTEEEASLGPILAQWSAELVAIEAFTTPHSEGVRHCVYLQASSEPRQASQAKPILKPKITPKQKTTPKNHT